MPTNLTPEQLIAEARKFQSGWPKLSIDRLVGQLADALVSAQQLADIYGATVAKWRPIVERVENADAKNHRLFELRVQAELRADRAEQRIQELEQERDRAKLEMLDAVEAIFNRACGVSDTTGRSYEDTGLVRAQVRKLREAL